MRRVFDAARPHLRFAALLVAGACGSRTGLHAPGSAPVAAVDVAPVDAAAEVATVDVVGDETVAPDAALDAPCRRAAPRAWWRAEGDARDAQGASDGVVVGVVGSAAGRVGAGFSLPGGGAHVRVVPTDALRITGSITVSAWVAYEPGGDGSPFAPVVSRWNDLGVDRRGYFLAVLPDGRARWDVSTDGRFASMVPTTGSEVSASNAALLSAARVPAGRFTHLAATFDAATGAVALWVDGTREASLVAPFRSIYDTPEPVLLGAGDLGSARRSFARGALDEVEVYAEVLDGADIAELAAGRRPRCR